GAPGAGSGLQCVQSHGFQAPFSTRSRWVAAAIMPRFAGVSDTDTLWRMRRSPRPRADAAMFLSCPCRLFTSVTLSLLSVMALARDLFEALAPLGRDPLGRADLRPRVH